MGFLCTTKKISKKGGGGAFSLHRRGRGEGGTNDNNVINKSSSPAAFLLSVKIYIYIYQKNQKKPDFSHVVETAGERERKSVRVCE